MQQRYAVKSTATFINIIIIIIKTLVRSGMKNPPGVIYINIMIIILSRHQPGHPRPTLATPPYRSLLLAGPQGCIPYPHRAAVCMFELLFARAY